MKDSKSNIETQIKTMLNKVLDDSKEECDENFQFSDEEETEDDNLSHKIFNQSTVNGNIDFNVGLMNNSNCLNKNDFVNYENNNFIRKDVKKSLTINNQNSISQNNFYIPINNRNYFQTQIIHKPFYLNNNFFSNNTQFIFPNYVNHQQIENPNNIISQNEIINNSTIHNNLRTEKKKKTYEMKPNTLLKSQTLNKKFGSVTLPRDMNVKIEMLLFEIKKLISKANKIDYLIYSKLQGNFINIIKDHKGSRIFQNYLKNTHSDILHQILMEILPYLKDLIIDPYANYFCRRFFTYLNQKDRNEYLNSIKDSLVELSCNIIGTYPIQGIIEFIGSKTEKQLVINSIKNYIYKLAFDPYGSHVIEKIISCFEEDLSYFIYDFIINNFINLAYNSNGICLVKKMIIFIHKQKYHQQIKKIIQENSFNLIKHPYGNYVFQVLINNWNEKEVFEIFNLFKNQLSTLSLEKYASNVMERWIEKSEFILSYYIKEIINKGTISEIMKSNFGNYVIQKALKIALGENKIILVNEVNNNIYKLNDKKLIEKWKKIILSLLN